MATIETGSIVSDIRGSVGGETYARNRGGLYVKTRSTPAQPASTRRDATQASFTTLIKAWSGTLNEAQRETWRQYAATWKTRNRLGQPVTLPAHCHFVKCNFYYQFLFGSILTTTAPPEGPIHIPKFTFSADSATNKVEVDLPILNYPTPVNFMFLLLYCGKVINPGRNFYSTPWRFAGYVFWTGTAWSRDPWQDTYPWTLVQGDRIHCKMAGGNLTGVTSGHYQTSALIT